MPPRTGLINFSCGNACKSQPWSFVTPDRPIAIPDMGRGAFKSLVSLYDRHVGCNHKRRVEQNRESKSYHEMVFFMDEFPFEVIYAHSSEFGQ